MWNLISGNLHLQTTGSLQLTTASLPWTTGILLWWITSSHHLSTTGSHPWWITGNTHPTPGSTPCRTTDSPRYNLKCWQHPSTEIITVCRERSNTLLRQLMLQKKKHLYCFYTELLFLCRGHESRTINIH